MTKPKSSLLETLLHILLSRGKKAKQKSTQKKRKPKVTTHQDKQTRKRPSDAKTAQPSTSPRHVVQTVLSEAQNLLGISYQYGGTSPHVGFDCSGLVYYLFDNAGLKLQRASYLQAEEGKGLNVGQTSPGDLIFFSHSGDRINHVGIVTSNPGEPLTMIHASSSKGVIQTNVAASNYWKSRLKGARRVV